MALPVNIEKLIKGTVVETERIEFKKGWNPEAVIHTMCAFANDINNLGGGYIVIGVDEEDGSPILPPAGLQKNQLDAIQKKLVELSNKIQPTYFAVSEPTKVQGQYVFVLYCPGGDNRPYKAPVSLSVKMRGHANWIRRYNSTVRADDQETQQLHELAAKIPFDDRINHQASLNDLKLSLIKEFLQEIDSPLFEQADDISFTELCRQMQIVKGPVENLKPVNVGLLLFNDEPDQFFPGAKIEVIIYQDEVGDRFSEKVFTGPIHKQLTRALEYLETNVIREEVMKVEGKAQANRFYNYPYAAIEEVLANAVYHRSYELRNTIEVNVRLDQIEVLSFPGPLPPVDNKTLQKERIVARNYRNRRIGDFLKELQLTEGRSTGFPKIYDTMEKNGSPEPKFETDDDQYYFLATLPVHDRLKEQAQAGAQAGAQVQKYDLNKTEKAILAYLDKGPSSRSDIINHLGSGSRSGYFKETLKGLLEDELIAYTHPDSPTHPDQKYKITDVGKQQIT
ncbi:RNA-binding domain-containing protein [Fodinibius salsisoli]|uniref:DNA binding domain-containing protein n=1 Tax=Fodinibius salsisoli TaxID=2820877 RepID=A0ABT3PSI9_9BACT|nr:RNA-binding domain-containing protein [Fodinibius salsisoli]MCW9708835.1 putative DNA binding domain-containing protein [Fodinibius salsisoli]